MGHPRAGVPENVGGVDLIDAFASSVHYAEHLIPIWRALGQPGIFFCADRIAPRLREAGVAEVVPGRVRGGPGPVMVASFSDLWANRRFPAVFVEHGAGQTYLDDRHSSYAGGRDRESVGLFLCPNEHVAEANRRAYPKARVEIVGCPKLDGIRDAQKVPGLPATVAFSFHFDGGVAPEASWAYPHFRNALRELARSGPWRLLGHGHPRAWARLEPFWREIGVESTPHFARVLDEADLFVVDNSSTGPEFASTGRPIAWLSAPWYRRDVHHGGRFWDWLPAGEHIEHPEDLVAGIARALADTPERRDLREQMVRDVYAYRGDATARAAATVMDWLREAGWETLTRRAPRPRGRS